jgi:hypothetical protein
MPKTPEMNDETTTVEPMRANAAGVIAEKGLPAGRKR